MNAPRTLLLACCLCSCTNRPGPLRARRDPGAIPLDEPAMDTLFQELRRDSHGDLKGVIVVVGGRVREEYFNGERPETLHDVRSAGKSVTSLLVGVAIDRGLIGGVNRSVLELLGAAGAGPGRAALA